MHFQIDLTTNPAVKFGGPPKCINVTGIYQFGCRCNSALIPAAPSLLRRIRIIDDLRELYPCFQESLLSLIEVIVDPLCFSARCIGFWGYDT